METLLLDSNIWFTFSFIIFVTILYKAGAPALNKMLDARISQIKKDLETSESLRIEAQEMLAQYQRKHRDAVQESEKIIEQAKENAAAYKKIAEADLNEIMNRREQQLEERLKRMEINAINQIQIHAAKLAMSAAKQIIIEKLDKKEDSRLIDKSIIEIKNNIH